MIYQRQVQDIEDPKERDEEEEEEEARRIFLSP